MNEVANTRFDKSVFKREQFHNDLHLAIEEANMRWNALSETIGIPNAILKRIVNDRSIPDLCSYWWLCRWLGKPVDYYLLKKRPRTLKSDYSTT
jgi:transcriptional regulator with XRE-family HTH domain